MVAQALLRSTAGKIFSKYGSIKNLGDENLNFISIETAKNRTPYFRLIVTDRNGKRHSPTIKVGTTLEEAMKDRDALLKNIGYTKEHIKKLTSPINIRDISGKIAKKSSQTTKAVKE